MDCGAAAVFLVYFPQIADVGQVRATVITRLSPSIWLGFVLVPADAMARHPAVTGPGGGQHCTDAGWSGDGQTVAAYHPRPGPAVVLARR